MTTKPKFLAFTETQVQSLRPGAFILLDTKAGCHSFLILMRMPVNSGRMTVDLTLDVNNNSEFRQYYVMDVDGSVVGSLLKVRAKFCKYTPLTVSRVVVSDIPLPMRCLTNSASGGLYMFTDGNGSCMALSEASSYPTSHLIIRDKQ